MGKSGRENVRNIFSTLIYGGLMEQDEIWDKSFKNKDLETLMTVQDFQSDLKKIIDNLRKGKDKIIEIGCGTGLTSLILDKRFDKYLFDLNKYSIKVAQCFFKKNNSNAHFIVGDMFQSGLADNSFDIVFNAGVIEHFSYPDRVKALKEYKRILKKDGIMLIAFPNHYSRLYRFSYLLSSFLKIWDVPPEFKLYDLRDELKESNLTLVDRKVVSKKMTFEFFPFSYLKGLFLFLDKLFNFEGYLTVLLIKKMS